MESIISSGKELVFILCMAIFIHLAGYIIGFEKLIVTKPDASTKIDEIYGFFRSTGSAGASSAGGAAGLF